MKFTNILKPIGLGLGMFVCFSAVQAQAPQQTKDGSTVLEQKVKHNQYTGANFDQTKRDYYANPSNFHNIPGFPVYIDTGNPTGDALNYENSKQQWIENNEELYRSMQDDGTANILRRTIVNGNTTTYYVLMEGLSSVADAASWNNKVLANPEVISASTNYNTKVCVLTVSSSFAPSALESIFDIR